MDPTDQQWTIIEPLFEGRRRPDGRGRPWRDARAVLNIHLYRGDREALVIARHIQHAASQISAPLRQAVRVGRALERLARVAQ